MFWLHRFFRLDRYAFNGFFIGYFIFQNLQSKHEKLLLENSDLRKCLLDQSQDQHRQAGLFSRNKPKADPKPPGRKSGKK